MTRSDTRTMNIAVGIATAGRPDILAGMLAHLARQSRLPDAVLICPADDSDVDWDHAAHLPLNLCRVQAGRGSSMQRNAILDAATDADAIVFFDDDFLPARSFIAALETLLQSQPDIVAATGEVLADGIHGPGLSIAEGLAILARGVAGEPAGLRPVYNAYGCNMAFRTAAITRTGARFDENMPLYGWQEDADFSRQLAGEGRIIQASTLRGVHLGHKRGRTSGLRFGYSQIANPFYLVGKGTMHLRQALRLAGGNLAANVVGSLRRPGLVDRRGRLRGNCLALLDILRRRCDPRRILTM